MGTSAKNPGPSPASALVPSWLDAVVPDVEVPAPAEAQENPETEHQPPAESAQPEQHQPNPLPALPPTGDANRFRAARRSFNRATGGAGISDSLRRSVSDYVRTGMGGSGRAAGRMRHSSRTAGQMIGFAQDVRERGFPEAARQFGIQDIAGKSVGESVARITEAFCGPGGSTDEAITRAAWNDTLLQAVEQGFVDFEALTAEQWGGLIELYVAKSIELRVFNDVGNDSISNASDVEQVNAIQAALHDLIAGAVHGRVVPLIESGQRLSDAQLQQISDNIYELAFAYLEELGGEE
jgi:hypothetical protein